MKKSCFFIGHSNTGAEVLPLLAEAVERHITEYGVTSFYVGHYGSFDDMAAHTVKEAKKRHPEVRLMLVLPYHPAIRPIEKPTATTALIIRGRESASRNAWPSSRPISAWSTTATI